MVPTEMMGYSFVVASVVLALFGANASAGDRFQPETCDVDYRLHENLASVLTNDTGIGMLGDLRQNVIGLCTDPVTHNAAVGLMDAIADVSTDKNVAQTLGNVFFWARKLIKDPYFRAAWDQTMRGLNMLFERHELVSRLSDTVYENLTRLLDHPNFDEAFEAVVEQLSVFMDVRKKMMYGAGALLVRNPLTGRRNSNGQRQPLNTINNVQRQNSNRNNRR